MFIHKLFSKIVVLINVTWSECIKYSVFLYFYEATLFRAVVVNLLMLSL